MKNDNSGNSNDNHPEMRADEEWITNHRENDLINYVHFYAPPYRIGKVAYNSEGEKLEGYVPVFKKKEAGISGNAK